MAQLRQDPIFSDTKPDPKKANVIGRRPPSHETCDHDAHDAGGASSSGEESLNIVGRPCSCQSGETVDKCTCPIALMARSFALVVSGSPIEIGRDTLMNNVKEFVEAEQRTKETKEQEENAKKRRRAEETASSDVTMNNDETKLPKVRRIPSDGGSSSPHEGRLLGQFLTRGVTPKVTKPHQKKKEG